ncbi:hypothetical protein WK59_29875 [Burkholderia ubonensis]|uniref:hypothetical protein n=1 Tax=Burkholderia ubonensis TaxID=101571 RepID=UPI00075EC44C|nr:hypothetical protein [Burkholderia ubonensis]KVT95290.1 hypothetical protein WK59_29875 [Burkholderia ubonensis]
MNETDFKLIVFSSFLGAIRNGVRAIAYDHSGSTISIYVYLDRTPDDEDYEVVSVAISEIMASCPSLTRQKIELLGTDESIGRSNSYKGWVFVRHEGDHE